MKTFGEFILECELVEGKVEWDNPKKPLQSGFTPREKNRAKRKLMDIERPEKLDIFDTPTTRRYERYGNLKSAHDKEKDKKVPKNKIQKFKKAPHSSSGKTIGQIRRASGTNLIRSTSSLKQDVYQSNLKEPKD